MQRAKVSLFFLTFITVLTLLPNVAHCDVKLSHISSVYLPSANDQRIAFDEQAVEQIAYDPVRKLIYAAGAEVFHVINVKDPANFVVEQSNFEYGSDFTDIEICGDLVFLTVVNITDPSLGSLRVYKRFDKDSLDSLKMVLETEVGSIPDMVHVLADCRTALIAVEGEAFSHGGMLVNPEGYIAVVQLQIGASPQDTQATVSTLKFDAFNDRYDELKPSGVRFVFTENKDKFSCDIEPEYIAVDEDEKKAYVVLQENNAIAEVDLTTWNITSIRGLGYKQWGNLDASDKDGELIQLKPQGITLQLPVKAHIPHNQALPKPGYQFTDGAWYTPDAAKYHQWGGRKLLFTANEGDSKEYATPVFDESIRGKNIPQSQLSHDLPEMVRTALVDDAKLGRLTFSKIDGKDDTGNYSALYTFGGRSFSIWDLTSSSNQSSSSALSQVFDSGSQFEETIALYCPHLFNREGDKVDGRSDNKGPEPESIVLGEINNRLYIFIGNERPGSIIVYSLGRQDSMPRFETIYCEGIPDSAKPIAEMFNERKLNGMDPEDIRFVPASESPTGRPVLMVAGTVSGTVTLLDISLTS